MNIKQRIIGLLSEYEKGKYSNILLNEYFSKNNLSKGERGFITEVFYGVIRNEIYLNYQLEKRTKAIKKNWIKNLLKISIYQATFMNSDEKGIAWEATELAKKKFGAPIGKFVNGVIRGYLREKDQDIKTLKEEDKLNILYSYPKWFYNKIKEEYKDEAEALLISLKKIPYLSVRVNTLKYTTEEFETFLKKFNVEIIKKVDTVYYIDSGIVIHSDEFKEGKIIAQDASSYLAAKILEPKEGDVIVDTCSAPGSKSAVLAELMNNTGEIYALDIYPHKLKLINENMKKLGVTCVKAINLDARKLKDQGLKFDKILVDAPCSGYGVLRKKPEALYNKNMSNIEELAILQQEILTSVSQTLKVGGELVYSTCTIFDEENTNNIKKFLENNSNFSVVKIQLPEDINGVFDELGGFIINYTEEILDNFYIIKLRKDS
ncbi:16S rRNA (cytosine(967)-C(5))-methyltransferase RsmB [uncultured Cetobacterium sp.]|uniref:16S rRNA (cytosine(967)-C(5))-methyltransferase RsmB n=1 Tax=uncultured Cetobacterium sp. TaxID=527638 RepID=UPI002626DE36|nr:16S rRNA (cytosine(967)-C(5))-methyltransferase RsmB [uncultured Cetobacterium sp.]